MPPREILGFTTQRSTTVLRSASASRFAAGGDVIGIDLGTTNSCVAVMEGKVTAWMNYV
jgi:hypothetical protein